MHSPVGKRMSKRGEEILSFLLISRTQPLLPQNSLHRLFYKRQLSLGLTFYSLLSFLSLLALSSLISPMSTLSVPFWEVSGWFLSP